MRSVSSPVERVLACLEVHPLGCWVYTGTTDAYGYGVVGDHQRSRFAHRVVYEDFVGQIPSGLSIDHLCFNAKCVNPAHLEAVTLAENTRRQWAAGRGRWGTAAADRQRAKTHCPQGHPYDEINTRQTATCRKCRACDRDRAARRRARRNAA